MNLLDYLATKFDSFDDAPFNVLDSAVLSQFCMVRCEGLVPTARIEKASRISNVLARTLPFGAKRSRFVDLLRAEHYASMFCGLSPESVKSNLLALAASPRFRDLSIREYTSTFDEGRQTQFAAVCLVHERSFAYVGFRGTDTSITGWRENFNMVATSPVPAQQMALSYLEAVAGRLPERLIVGGHSKGANLALYAALKASPAVQKRIERVYALDGPGFKQGAVSDGEWEALEGRVHRSIPQQSIVGMLMNCPVEAHIAVSREHGLNQHSPFTWEVNDEANDFVYTDKLSDSARFFDEAMSSWLSLYSDEEAARIVDALFKAIEASGTTNASEIFFGGLKTLPLIAKAAQNIDAESRRVLTSAVMALASTSGQTATNLIKGARAE